MARAGNRPWTVADRDGQRRTLLGGTVREWADCARTPLRSSISVDYNCRSRVLAIPRSAKSKNIKIPPACLPRRVLGK